MTTLEDKLEQEQIIYQQNFNDNLLNNKSKKKTSKILLICGIIIIVFEIILNFFIVVGRGIGLGFSECEGDGEEYEKCEEELSKQDKKLNDAIQLIMPCLIFTCIILCLCFSYNKKIIIINCICIIIKLFLFIGYLNNLQYTWEGYNFLSLFIIFLPEITSDICLLANEKLKFTIKN